MLNAYEHTPIVEVWCSLLIRGIRFPISL